MKLTLKELMKEYVEDRINENTIIRSHFGGDIEEDTLFNVFMSNGLRTQWVFEITNGLKTQWSFEVINPKKKMYVHEYREPSYSREKLERVLTEEPWEQFSFNCDFVLFKTEEIEVDCD